MICQFCDERLEGKLVLVYDAVYERFLENGTSTFEKSTICYVCLNLFNHETLEAIATKVGRKFAEDPFDTQSFNLTIGYPKSLLIRDKILQLLAQEKFQIDEPDFGWIKDVFKHVLRRKLESCLKLESDMKSDFNINLIFSHPQDEVDLKKFLPFLQDKNNSEKKRKNIDLHHDPSPVSKVNLSNKLPDLDLAIMQQIFGSVDDFWAGKILENECQVDVSFERQPLFLGGRYCKYSRYVHQTPWLLDGETRSKNSVLEILLQSLQNGIRCDDVKFTASGREDADVRMLGDGRPFALQFLNPRKKKHFDLADFESKINKSSQDIETRRLKIVTQADFDFLNKSVDSKIKHYVALCYYAEDRPDGSSDVFFQEKTSQLTFPLEINQKTPIRVLHRRPLLDRKRRIFHLGFLPVDEHHFQLKLATEAGTYVKEFVHGDFGRTRPSLAEILGVKVDILELDVEKVDFDWPI